jgi:hypothetical protein
MDVALVVLHVAVRVIRVVRIIRARRVGVVLVRVVFVRHGFPPSGPDA